MASDTLLLSLNLPPLLAEGFLVLHVAAKGNLDYFLNIMFDFYFMCNTYLREICLLEKSCLQNKTWNHELRHLALILCI